MVSIGWLELVQSYTRSEHCKEGAEFSAALKAMTPIFNRNRFVVRLVGFLALLISFGVAFPPLEW
jgi:hypothetical protein